MDTDQGQVEQRLGHEVAVGDGVEEFSNRAAKPSSPATQVGVERQRRPGQRAGPERRHVEAPPGGDQPVDVAGQRPAVGQQVVGQQDRLGPLQMGVAGQVGVPGLPARFEEHLLEVDDPAGPPEQRPLGEQPQVGGHLVVAAAAGVQPAADVAGDLGDPPLDGGVDVLVARLEHEGALGELLLDPVERGQQDPGCRPRRAAPALQTQDMGPAASHVVGGQPPVEGQADGEGLKLFRLVRSRRNGPARASSAVTLSA